MLSNESTRSGFMHVWIARKRSSFISEIQLGGNLDSFKRVPEVI
jgi:hypothetical protein